MGTGAAAPEADFVRQVREAFLKPACVRSAFTAADEKLALNLCQRGVPLEQLRRAIWLGCARKYVAMLNGQTRQPITSLAYFASLIDEVARTPDPRQLLGTCHGTEWRKWKNVGYKPRARRRQRMMFPQNHSSRK